VLELAAVLRGVPRNHQNHVRMRLTNMHERANERRQVLVTRERRDCQDDAPLAKAQSVAKLSLIGSLSRNAVPATARNDVDPLRSHGQVLEDLATRRLGQGDHAVGAACDCRNDHSPEQRGQRPHSLGFAQPGDVGDGEHAGGTRAKRGSQRDAVEHFDASPGRERSDDCELGGGLSVRNSDERMRDQFDLADPVLRGHTLPSGLRNEHRDAKVGTQLEQCRQQLPDVRLEPTHSGLQEDRIDSQMVELARGRVGHAGRSYGYEAAELRSRHAEDVTGLVAVVVMSESAHLVILGFKKAHRLASLELACRES
jgi:hypothetical protein